LADSGLVKVFDINGGISHLHLSQYNDGCGLFQSNLPYKIISPQGFSHNKKPGYFICGRPARFFVQVYRFAGTAKCFW
jgi:hypothetical protein